MGRAVLMFYLQTLGVFGCSLIHTTCAILPDAMPGELFHPATSAVHLPLPSAKNPAKSSACAIPGASGAVVPDETIP